VEAPFDYQVSLKRSLTATSVRAKPSLEILARERGREPVLEYRLVSNLRRVGHQVGRKGQFPLTGRTQDERVNMPCSRMGNSCSAIHRVFDFLKADLRTNSLRIDERQCLIFPERRTPPCLISIALDHSRTNQRLQVYGTPEVGTSFQ
jgi:hypothetical protein